MRHIWLLVAGSVLIAGCGNFGGSLPDTHVLVITDLSTQDEQDYATAFYDGFARKARRFKTMSLDRLLGETTVVDYSGASSREVVEDVMLHRLNDLTPSTDEALIAAARRVLDHANGLKEGQRLVAVILTNGTRNPATISTLTRIVSTIPASGNVTIYVAGVQASNVTALTPVFSTMPANAAVIGTLDSDLKTLMRRL
ncbi:VWA domain-containing protein [Acaryochloris sp. CCMEE 5410]|uniref:VWA domain-containing protein n=1 Tax=Acaryochloris sp. CCMEE 5410 TaxID=310037 RepID=UPI0002483A2A|nr:VWA domain-containing protein [Acaryochloris sp. CCMEE 5410]KAI9130009.1 VWA domain-containing protein [Acaryochloris sp. CCMEE 5410]